MHVRLFPFLPHHAMRTTQRESLRHVLAVVRADPKLAGDVQVLLPLLDPPRRTRVRIVPRDDQTHIPL